MTGAGQPPATHAIGGSRPAANAAGGSESAGAFAADDVVADCTALIIAYNSAADLGGLLDSLPAAADGLRVRVVVIDNDSVDDVARVAARPGVRLVPAGGNLGYAGGINVGRAHLGPTRSVLILNPDLRLAAGSVRGLVAALAPGVGAVVPRFEDSSGVRYPSLRREPSVLRAFGDAVLGKRWPARPGWLSEMVWPVPAYEKESPVEWSTGAAILIRLEADAQVGPWDAERFFLYSEETDYLRRVRAAGWAVRYVPSAVVVHRGGGSGSGPELVALGLVNRLRYFRKYHGRPATAAFGAAVLLGELLRARRPASRRALSILVRPSRWADLPGGRRVPAGDRVARPAAQGADQAEDARVSGIARSLPGGHRR